MMSPPAAAQAGIALPMTVEQVVLVAFANGEHGLMHDDDAQLRSRCLLQSLPHALNLLRRRVRRPCAGVAVWC